MPRVNKENPSARNWCFTLNNYTDADMARIAKPYEWVKYVAYSHEVGEAEGTPHLQGYLCAWEPVTMKNVKLYLPRAHLEVMHGRLQDNDNYITKQSEMIEIGERPMQGRRSDLIGFKRKIDAGERPVDIADEEPHFGTYVKYHAGMEKYHAHKQAKIRKQEGFRPPKVYIIIGSPGVGKSKSVYVEHGYDNVWAWNSSMGTRFDEYRGESVVLFEDVQKDQIPKLNVFKQLLDGHPVPISYKYGTCYFNARTIYITSNEEPISWYDYENNTHYHALMDRVFQAKRVFKDAPDEVFHTSSRYGF